MRRIETTLVPCLIVVLQLVSYAGSDPPSSGIVDAGPERRLLAGIGVPDGTVALGPLAEPNG